MPETPRKLLSVTLRPDMFERVKAEAAKCDIATTTWVRMLIEEKLSNKS